MEDAVIKPVEGIDGGLCAKCRKLKPLSEFKRKLSLLQSRALGYAGNYPLEVVSKYCKPCQPATQSLRQMSKRRLAELVSQGVIPQLVADNVLDSREKTGRGRQRYAAARRHEQIRKESWSFVLAPLAKEIAIVTQQAKHAGYAEDKFRRAYTELYKKVLVSVREEIKARRDLRGEGIGSIEDWRQIASIEEVQEVLAAWRDIPTKTRAKMRIGLLINPEWRSHCGATNPSSKVWEGKAATAQRIKTMDDLREVTRQRIAAQKEREEELGKETDQFLANLLAGKPMDDEE